MGGQTVRRWAAPTRQVQEVGRAALERRSDAAQGGDVIAEDLVGAVDRVVERADAPGLAGRGHAAALNTMCGVAIAVNMLVNEVGSGTSAF
jgi:hypothetical protein